MTNLTDVQKALEDSQVLDQHWITGGWDALSTILEEELMGKQVLDIYPHVEIDISVNVTIVLPDKIYNVPLEDISEIPINDCLVIGIEDLYLDWEERVWKKIEKSNLIHHSLTLPEKGKGKFHLRKFLGIDHRIRTVKQTVI